MTAPPSRIVLAAPYQGIVSAKAGIAAMAQKVTRSGVVKHASGLAIRRADLDRAQPFRWAWNQRVLLGYINLQVGEEGVGKGNLTAWQAARITRGELDGDLKGSPRQVLFIGDEDAWDHIWVPRLHAAGANLDLLAYIEAGTTGGVLDVRKDADALRLLIEDKGTALVYFDQLLDNLGVADSWKDKEVRDALAPIRRVAQATGCAMLASMHPNKRGGSFRDRVSGTPAFNALSRSSLLVAAHPDEEGRAVVVRAKGNYSAEPPAFEFRIEEELVTVGKGARARTLTTSRICAIRETGLRRDELLAATAANRTRPESDASRAKAMLSEMFASGARIPAADALERMSAEGFSERVAQRARADLGIKTWKEGYQGGYMWGWKADNKVKVKSRRVVAPKATSAREGDR